MGSSKTAFTARNACRWHRAGNFKVMPIVMTRFLGQKQHIKAVHKITSIRPKYKLLQEHKLKLREFITPSEVRVAKILGE